MDDGEEELFSARASAGGPAPGVARLTRAIVVGPIARLELLPLDDSPRPAGAGSEPVIEAQVPSQQFREQGLREGDTVLVTPRRARVFVDEAAR